MNVNAKPHHAARPSVTDRRDGRLCTAPRTLLTRACYWIPTQAMSDVRVAATLPLQVARARRVTASTRNWHRQHRRHLPCGAFIQSQADQRSQYDECLLAPGI